MIMRRNIDAAIEPGDDENSLEASSRRGDSGASTWPFVALAKMQGMPPDNATSSATMVMRIRSAASQSGLELSDVSVQEAWNLLEIWDAL